MIGLLGVSHSVFQPPADIKYAMDAMSWQQVGEGINKSSEAHAPMGKLKEP